MKKIKISDIKILKNMTKIDISELVKSIKEYGLLYPIIIKKSNKNQYNRCKNCGRIKIARQVCEQCGTPEVEPDTTTGDDDEE